LVACDETKDFLLTLLDIIEDIGPSGVQKLCLEGGSECSIENGKFKEQLNKARDAIKKMECRHGT
jgi:hypothetical protein